MCEKNKNSVLIVDDENMDILSLSHILSPEYTIYAAKDGEKAIMAADKYMPDVILLDIIMPGMDGYTVLATLKKSDKTRDIPVIFISGLSNTADEEKGLSLGAADYIGKPFSPTIVKLRVHNQVKMLNQYRTIERLTMSDQLTEIFNRRGFDYRMNMEWIRAIRDNSVMSILMLDVDNFKVYNDTYGHQQGDVALQVVAQTIMQSLNRPGDIVARWGGEEFVVLLPNTDIKGALIVAERIRINISEIVVPCADGTKTKISVSVGVNRHEPNIGSFLENFISEADKALYRAKKTGKNRVCAP